MIRQLPPAPSRDNPGPFAAMADALLASLDGFVDDCNALEQSLIFVGTTGQSSTALAVGSGVKTLTASTGKAWVVGAWVHMVSAGGIGNVMVGQVQSYDVDTGALQVNVGAFAGSGTHSDWLIGLSSPQAPITAALIANGALAAKVSSEGGLLLPGDAVNALGAVPKQQAESIAAQIARPDLASLTVSVASNAMTCSLPAEVLNFRSATLGDGAAVARTASASTLTVPSGATLGTTNGVAARIAWGWIDNAGTPEPFVVNVGGTANLDETTLISTTAISGSANSVNTFYSQTARSNVAFRIRGWCDITEATAGTWATAPTKVQGASIQSLKSIQGRGRTPQNMLASRTFGVTYYNTTGYEIFVHTNIAWTSGIGAARLTVDGVNFDGPVFSSANQTSPTSAPIPPGGAYIFTGTNSIGFTLIAWNESR